MERHARVVTAKLRELDNARLREVGMRSYGTPPPGCPLTVHQYRVLGLAAEGLVFKEIARRLGRSHSCVRQHAVNAYRRLEVHNVQGALALMYRRGWL